MWRTDNLIAIDFSSRAIGLDCGHQTTGQANVLLHCDRCLAVGEVILNAILEDHADKGQTIERSRADDIDSGRGVESNFHWTGVITFHLLGGETRCLRRNLQDYGRRIGIRLDVELLESNEPGSGKQQ